MQDYNYIWGGCMEITLEISCCKYPKFHRLPQFWTDNKHALLKYLGEAHQGKSVQKVTFLHYGEISDMSFPLF